MYSVNVRLPAALQAFVEAQLEGGKYETAAEVVRDALREAQKREAERELAMTALRREIGFGIAQFEAGEYTRYESGRDFVEQSNARTAARKKTRNG